MGIREKTGDARVIISYSITFENGETRHYQEDTTQPRYVPISKRPAWMRGRAYLPPLETVQEEDIKPVFHPRPIDNEVDQLKAGFLYLNRKLNELQDKKKVDSKYDPF